jgi:hypothetical protein
MNKMGAPKLVQKADLQKLESKSLRLNILSHNLPGGRLGACALYSCDPRTICVIASVLIGLTQLGLQFSRLQEQSPDRFGRDDTYAQTRIYPSIFSGFGRAKTAPGAAKH